MIWHLLGEQRTRYVVLAVAAAAAVALVAALLSLVGPLAWNVDDTTTAAQVGETTITQGDVNASLAELCAARGIVTRGQWRDWLAENGFAEDEVREHRLAYLVRRERVRQLAEDEGVQVEDYEVEHEVEMRRAEYLAATESEDDGAWEQALADAGYTAESYTELVRTELLENRLQTLLAARGEDYYALIE